MSELDYDYSEGEPSDAPDEVRVVGVEVPIDDVFFVGLKVGAVILIYQMLLGAIAVFGIMLLGGVGAVLG